jgi:hypothetical protein
VCSGNRIPTGCPVLNSGNETMVGRIITPKEVPVLSIPRNLNVLSYAV